MSRKIAVLTSGGDAPGMNAAIRSVTRSAIAKGWTVMGVNQGYAGLVAGDYRELAARDVGGLLSKGGTFLGSARCPEFQKEDVREKALRNLNRSGIGALVVIGGNGSQTGGAALNDMGFPTLGVASTIDNDLVGSEITIGVDTALNIALEAIDRLRVTAASHQRGFLIEVMGRKCGYLALMAGIAGGAELVLVPEIDFEPDQIAEAIHDAYRRGKAHAMVVVAEGAKHNAEQLVRYFHDKNTGFELRATILGHVQRGGTPTAYDRLLASRLGAGAVEALDKGISGVVVGMNQGVVSTTPYSEVTGRTKGISPELYQLAHVLSR
ncbi:6-phosphofructokinase [Candidatus Koribacter versatilis Ellin345]|uniref:ATP-dependent 6-phosphofructokinase n=1 Tax=Koribacter versatilis (strain Ellin345) TaxID=204669 RepID=Q1IM67_KORVE|nr:6-phosphofructokinase [Candidatus Koribacter versatilis]ABF42033.1 6-phosphofructokinase [Candidatus Koribacter versatilis Ellin345]